MVLYVPASHGTHGPPAGPVVEPAPQGAADREVFVPLANDEFTAPVAQSEPVPHDEIAVSEASAPLAGAENADSTTADRRSAPGQRANCRRSCISCHCLGARLHLRSLFCGSQNGGTPAFSLWELQHKFARSP